jgi:hypothetical protein
MRKGIAVSVAGSAADVGNVRLGRGFFAKPLKRIPFPTAGGVMHSAFSRSEVVISGTGYGKPARPDLWEHGVGNHPGHAGPFSGGL